MSKVFDIEDQSYVPSEGGNARINTPGIHQNIGLISVELIDKPDDPAKNKKGFVACEFIFENERGEQHKELFMRPKFDPTTIDAEKTTKWYEDVNSKKVNTRKATPEEHIKIINNEFIYFLIDLGVGLGYTKPSIMQVMKKATDFKTAVDLFKKHFPFNKSRINMLLLYNNQAPYNGKPGSSWLRLYHTGNFPLYYPFGYQAFEPYVKDRKPALFISEYNYKNGMVEKYPYVKPEGPATNEPVVAGNMATSQTYASNAPVTANGADEPDPF